MKQYEIYIFQGETAFLRGESNNIDRACDIACDLEKGDVDGTFIYDSINKKYFGYHKKGTAYILSK